MCCYLTFLGFLLYPFFLTILSFFCCSCFVITLCFFRMFSAAVFCFILPIWSYLLLGLLPLLMFCYFYFLWLLFFRLCICFVDFSVFLSLSWNRSSYFLVTILGYLVCFFHPLYLWLVFCLCFYIIWLNIFS